MKKIALILMALFGILTSNVAHAQVEYPGGAACDAAIPITDGFFNTPLDGLADDHWYSFVAPCSGMLTITNGSLECEKRIYSGVCGSLMLLAEGTWADASISCAIPVGESVLININDSWDLSGEFTIEFAGCDGVDSTLLDISGRIYYDANNNGVKDIGENGKPLTLLQSDPSGLFCVSGVDGFYFSSVADLDDGIYEISPVLPVYWGVSSDSLSYTINVDPLYEQRDSLDFGLYPDTIIHVISPILTPALARCNDTINYWLDIHNIGTTFPAGSVHLELDDSLNYVSANVVPDSIVGQHIYWHYDPLYFGAHTMIIMELGTPDGFEDIVSSTVWVTIDSAEVELFSSEIVVEQVVSCAYDPNDKTPTPLGVGEFGYISPLTESIEYLIRFQNTGTDTAFNVVIKDQLDENLEWNSITILSYSHWMTFEMDMYGEVSFIFDDIMLPDSNVNMLASQGFVKYRVDLVPGLPLETSIFNTANIYFDLNPAIVTNTTINTLHVDASGLEDLAEKQQLLVYPNPFSENVTVYFGEELKNYSVQLVDLLGNEVYLNNQVNGSQLQIEAGYLTQGMYILLLVDNDSGEVMSNAKLMVK